MDDNYQVQLEQLEREIEEWETFHGFHMGDIEFIETMHDKDNKIAQLRAALEGIVSLAELNEPIVDATDYQWAKLRLDRIANYGSDILEGKEPQALAATAAKEQT